MTVLVYLIPVALLIGLASLAAFLWALKSGQYEDLDGAAERILIDSEPDGKVGGKTGHNAGGR
ncbi:MAG: cbb3-type cytochrome oxidase assembly protein CcoS [Afipia sp.]|jgi:cbb3-type cytochrome oxidase maturation protein|nr:cbb3-type cytochrome oxidase assembly protein CcoS [Afipia sp.]